MLMTFTPVIIGRFVQKSSAICQTRKSLLHKTERTVFLEGLGLRVVRFTNAQILENFDGVCAELRVILG